MPDTSAPSMSTSAPARQRASADDLMRRLLRVGGARSSAKAAQSAMSTSIFVSAVRCILTYLVIPVLQPVAHVLGLVSRPLSMVLCVLGAYMSTRSMRRFWATDHPKRWAYTAFAAVLISYLAYGFLTDLDHLVA